MSEKKYPQKATCYKTICKVVRTGFHLENYPVCKTCGLELTESLYHKIMIRDEEDKEIQLEIDKLWDGH